MKIVVDTNIIFSAVLNTQGKIGDLLLNSTGYFDFVGADFLKEELVEHHDKLKSISKLSDQSLEIAKERIFRLITFVTPKLIPTDIFIEAEKLVADIDPDDTEHIALTLFLEAKFWSGDKPLHRGLCSKGITWVLNTEELIDMRHTLEHGKSM